MNDLGKQVCRCIVGACDETCRYYDVGKSCCVGYEKVAEQAEKVFAEYENYKKLEEQGKLLKFPCRLGDTTFWISDEDEDGNKIPTVRENNPIVGIAIQEDGLYILADGDSEYQKVGTIWAFLTREEAEAALKKYKID